jgi:hypothetical protein
MGQVPNWCSSQEWYATATDSFSTSTSALIWWKFSTSMMSLLTIIRS